MERTLQVLDCAVLVYQRQGTGVQRITETLWRPADAAGNPRRFCSSTRWIGRAQTRNAVLQGAEIRWLDSGLLCGLSTFDGTHMVQRELALCDEGLLELVPRDRTWWTTADRTAGCANDKAFRCYFGLRSLKLRRGRAAGRSGTRYLPAPQSVWILVRARSVQNRRVIRTGNPTVISQIHGGCVCPCASSFRGGEAGWLAVKKSERHPQLLGVGKNSPRYFLSASEGVGLLSVPGDRTYAHASGYGSWRGSRVRCRRFSSRFSAYAACACRNKRGVFCDATCHAAQPAPA